VLQLHLLLLAMPQPLAQMAQQQPNFYLVRSYKMIQYTVLENGYILMDNNGVISTIPNDPANSDYQAYLKSLEV